MAFVLSVLLQRLQVEAAPPRNRHDIGKTQGWRRDRIHETVIATVGGLRQRRFGIVETVVETGRLEFRFRSARFAAGHAVEGLQTDRRIPTRQAEIAVRTTEEDLRLLPHIRPPRHCGHGHRIRTLHGKNLQQGMKPANMHHHSPGIRRASDFSWDLVEAPTKSTYCRTCKWCDILNDSGVTSNFDPPAGSQKWAPNSPSRPIWLENRPLLGPPPPPHTQLRALCAHSYASVLPYLLNYLLTYST